MNNVVPLEPRKEDALRVAKIGALALERAVMEAEDELFTIRREIADLSERYAKIEKMARNATARLQLLRQLISSVENIDT